MTDIIQTRAYARAGLIGNPSDGYHGKTISITLRNFSSRVTCYESKNIVIVPQNCDRLEFVDINDLMDNVRTYGYRAGIPLIKAAIRRFNDYCHAHGLDLDDKRNCTIEYETDIPPRLGLAGSSAIVTAVFRALESFYNIHISETILPNVILSVETDELGIQAGLQDRVVQVYEGTVYMDFDRQHMEKTGHGRYERIDTENLPPLFVAYSNKLAEGTEITHNSLRTRYDDGDLTVIRNIQRIADLAQQAKDLIMTGQGHKIGPLMNENYDRRATIVPITGANRILVETGRRLGAFVKFAGSSGAVIGTYDGSTAQLKQLTNAYNQIDATLIVPEI